MDGNKANNYQGILASFLAISFGLLFLDEIKIIFLKLYWPTIDTIIFLMFIAAGIIMSVVFGKNTKIYKRALGFLFFAIGLIAWIAFIDGKDRGLYECFFWLIYFLLRWIKWL